MKDSDTRFKTAKTGENSAKLPIPTESPIGNDLKDSASSNPDFLIDYLENHMGVSNAGVLKQKSGKIHCVNPDHEDKHPSMSMYMGQDGIARVKCFACDKSYDLLDLIQMNEGKGFLQAKEKAVTLYGGQAQDSGSATTVSRETEKAPDPAAVDFSKAVSGAQTNLFHPDSTRNPKASELSQNILIYLQNSRGLSLETIKKYQIGCTTGMNAFLQDYPKKWNKWTIPGNENEGKQPVEEELLYKIVLPYPDSNAVPYVEFHCPDRPNLEAAEKRYQQYGTGTAKNRKPGKYAIPKGTPKILLNERYITGVSPEIIWITEGYFDALSIEQSGGHAVAIGGVSGTNRLLKLIEDNPKDSNYIVFLDNDDAGKKAAESLLKDLNGQSLTYAISGTASEIISGAKDANEVLVKDPQALKQYVIQKEHELKQFIQETKEGEIESYRERCASNLLKGFRDRAKAQTSNPIPTGFKNLDELLDGGLYPGLYFIGAISSLGKTTFALQIMDQIAESGHDVLIFSLEMSSDELIAKSISRCSYHESLKHRKGTVLAKTTRGILTGSRYSNYEHDDMIVLNDAFSRYERYAGHIYIQEGLGDVGYTAIRKAVESHIHITGKTPVILIDYLQIMAPDEDRTRSSDKQIADKNVLELKRLSRDLKLPVIAISSFNRENYNAPVNLSSFKESGAIEYTSDVLIGLQYEGMDYQEGKNKNGEPSGSDETESKRSGRIRNRIQHVQELAKEGKPIPVQLKILKQRNAPKGQCFFDFTPKFNLFEESISEQEKKKAGLQTLFVPKLNL